MEKEQKEIDFLSKRIYNAIKISPSECIKIFEDLLLGKNPNKITFDEYLNQLQKTLKVCTCQSSWNHNQIMIHCLDCQKTSNSCICVNCFLKGNHQGHKILITHASAASCDCGDPLLWSPSGFCSDHPGPEPHPELTQLTKETRVSLIAITIAAMSKYISSISNETALNQIIDFLSKLVSIGDATRRCVCIGFQYSIRFLNLYINCYSLKKQEMCKLLKFLGSLTNDEVFRNYFSYSFLNDLPNFIYYNDNFAKMSNNNNSESQKELFQFTFHAVSIPQICEMIQEKKFDWKNIFIKSLYLLLCACFSNMNIEYFNRILYYETTNRIFSIFKSAVSVFDRKNSMIIDLINELSNILIEVEFTCPITRAFDRKIDDQKETQTCIYHIYYELYRLISKIDSKKFFTEKPLQLIGQIFEAPSFHSIDKSYNGVSEVYYRSVLDREVQFSQSFATILLAFDCLNLNSKEEEKNLYDIIKKYASNSDVEKFIKNWTIIPLRWVAASSLNDFRLFEKNSNATITALNSFNFTKNLKIKFVPTFALLQTLFKTTKDVDGFLLMIISTFGFFNCLKNDVDINENQKQLIFLSIFHFILCLIFDNLCVEKNFFAIRRLTIISKLMKSDLSVEEINSVWYDKVLNDDKFCDELANFTSKKKTKSGTKFHLTENSQWHPLLPFLSISSIIPLIQKFINNNPDSLINFPDLPNDSVSLLFSPTLWAIEYFILSQKCCKDYQIIHQLVFNALIITSQNSEQYHRNENENENENDDDSVLKVADFVDLSTKLKKLTFNRFLKKKISLNGVVKSMVDLISVFGNLGITVLTRLNISPQKTEEENHLKKEEMNKKKRERAKQMKMQIMSNFTKKQKSFQSSSTEEEKTNENSEKMECVICHFENDKDCFVYPALIYKSPLSSYIKWRFRNAHLVNNNKNDQNSGFMNDFSDIPESFDLFNFVRICFHPIHSKCIKSRLFTCPTDRCPRNSSIPIIAGIYDHQTELNQTVLLQATKFLKKAYNNDLKFAVYSLASQIEIIEMRHRSNPGCLDDKIIQATLRNIYLCLWFVLRNDSKAVLFQEECRIRKELISIEKETKTKLPKKILSPMNRFSYNIKNIFSSAFNFKKYEDIINDEDDDDDYDVDADVNNNDEKLYFSKIKNMRLSPLMFYILFSFVDLNKSDRLSMNDFIKGNFTLFSDCCIFDVEKDLNSDYKMLQFLRCAAIFDHFARGESITPNVNEFIDWDVILSSSHLCKHFNIKNVFSFDTKENDSPNKNSDEKENTNNLNESSNNDNRSNESNNNNENMNNNNEISNENENTNNLSESINNNNENTNNDNNDENNNVIVVDDKNENEMTLPMFSFIDLPKNFLDFIHPPYSVPILEYEECDVAICLLTGKTVKLNAFSFTGSNKCMLASQYVKDKFNSSFSVFLKLNGDNTSEVVVYDFEFNNVLNLNSFYVDKFGDKDIGMKRGSLLYLNESDKEEIIDAIFSGGWTNMMSFK